MAPNLTYDGFTERINLICYKLEHYTFLTEQERQKLEIELKDLVQKRTNLLKILNKTESDK